MSSLHNPYSTYLKVQTVHLSRSLAVDKPRRDIHCVEVARLRRLGPKIRKVLRHERSDATFVCAGQRRDALDSIILGESERKSCVSYVNPERAE